MTAPTPDPARRTELLLVEDDALFRETLVANLQAAGLRVQAFPDPAQALAAVAGGAAPDLLLLDWALPGMTGLELLKTLRGRGCLVPAIFLTSLGDPIYEETALGEGAIDFIDKARSLTVILKRIALRLQAGAGEPQAPAVPAPLRLASDSHRAWWGEAQVPLTITEFRVVQALALRAGRDFSFREIYDLVRGEGFQAGTGPDGYRTNVRALAKRLRQKFAAIDPAFDALEAVPGHGYRWREER